MSFVEEELLKVAKKIQKKTNQIGTWLEHALIIITCTCFCCLSYKCYNIKKYKAVRNEMGRERGAQQQQSMLINK